ncbi:putative reverse transcriptase domain-containing protein [Tanacetum coccineum]
MGSSSSAAAAGHNPEDLTPSHIRSDLDALHRRVRHIEEDDARADNKRLKMMLDCSENRTRDAWRELDRATWHYHHLRRWSITVENLLPPRLQLYKSTIIALTGGYIGSSHSNDPRDTIMPPRPMNQAAIERLVTEKVTADVEAERERQANARGQGNNEAGGQGGAPTVRECTFSGFMKCNPTVFHGHEGAVELSRWFEENSEMVATMGLEAANQIGWTEIRRLMTEEFCPIEEIQRMEHELWNLKVKDFDITAYTKRFHELVQLCPEMVPSERKKIEAYIRGLTDKDIKKGFPRGYKRKWESLQGGNNGNNRNNNRDNTRHNQQNNQRLAITLLVLQGSMLAIVESQAHMARECKEQGYATGANTRTNVSVNDGEKGTHKELLPEEKGSTRVFINSRIREAKRHPLITALETLRYGHYEFSSDARKAEQSSHHGALLQQPEILVWKWERITMDFIVGLPRTPISGKETDNMEKAVIKLDLKEIVCRTWECQSQILGQRPATLHHDFGLVTSREALGSQLDMSTACAVLVWWSEVGVANSQGPRMIRETTKKIVQIKNRLLTARSRQKSYADVRRRPLEFNVGDKVMLKVSLGGPWIRLGCVEVGHDHIGLHS